LRRFLGFTLAALVSICGCARTNTSTAVNSDGSFTRTVKFTGQAPAKEGDMSMGTKLEDAFLLPSGPAWKITKVQKNQDLTITATRVVSAGESLKDIIIKSKKAPGGRQVVNEISVRKVAPGRLEYKEVLHWQGEKGGDFQKAIPEITALLKKSLPPSIATDANSAALVRPIMREFWRLLFGPGDPLITQLMMHPDLVERRMRQKVGRIMNSLLLDKFGDKLTAKERTATAQKLITVFMAAGENASKSKSAEGPAGKDADDSALVAMLFSVKLPGKLVATNGEVDDSSGEVFWALYSQAAALEDVVMTATCEVTK